MCTCSIKDAAARATETDTPVRASIQGKRETTPEGFTKFRGVTIARTGEQLYGPSEVDPGGELEAGPDGMFHISRSASELFSPETIESLRGKPFINDHSTEHLTPKTFRAHIQGVVLDPRRGTGDQSDELLADILVMGEEALRDIDAGKTELSVGFHGITDHWGGGYGNQRNLLANHLALVTKARCGERCAINDHQPNAKDETLMSRIKKFYDAMVSGDMGAAKKIMDEDSSDVTTSNVDASPRVDALESSVNDVKSTLTDHAAKVSDMAITVSGINAKLDAMADTMAKLVEANQDDDTNDDFPDADESDVLDEMPEELDKSKVKDIKDSAYLAQSFYQARAKAEIIAPGVQMPVFDAAWDPKKTVSQSIHAMRRTALHTAINDAATAQLFTQVAGRVYDAAAVNSLGIDATRTMFNSVAALKTMQNNAGVSVGSTQSVGTNTTAQGGTDRSLAAYANYWKKA